MKARIPISLLLPLAVVLAGCSKSTFKGDGFEQTNLRSTPLRVEYAKRTEHFTSPDRNGTRDYRPETPADDVMLILVLKGVTVKEVETMERGEGGGVMFAEATGVARRLQMWGQKLSLSAAGGAADESVMMLVSVPRKAEDIKLVLGGTPPASLRVFGPVERELRAADVK
jgi:hypothetical protein